MNQKFEELISSYLEKKIGIAENFLTEDILTLLQQHILDLRATNRLQNAAIGDKKKRTENQTIRNDQTYWLNREHNHHTENLFMDLMDQLSQHLNTTCYAGIGAHEFHYAHYGPGSFYKRHFDQFRNNNNRLFTFILYLNSNWQPNHGGQLCIHTQGSQQLIEPLNGRCVFFRSSELEHEVLTSNSTRISVTGWFRTN